MARSKDWAAGLFEGEGCITGYKKRYPRLALGMTDRDSVEAFYEAMDHRGTFGPKNPQPAPPRKPMWLWRCSNPKEVAECLEILRPGLGIRRTARLEKALEMLRENAARRYAPTCTEQECNAPHFSHGLCPKHFARRYRAANLEKARKHGLAYYHRHKNKPAA